MSKIYYYTVLSFLFFACSSSVDEKVNLDNEKHVKEEVEQVAEVEPENDEPYHKDVGYENQVVSTNGLVLQYDQVTLCFDSIVSYNSDYYQMIECESDTLFYDLDLGESIDGEFFKVVADSIYTVQVYQQVEASVTVMNEGPHCDLIEWNNYTSPWRAVKTLQENQKFRALDYRYSNWENLFLIDLPSLKAAVSEHCGERWFELVKDVKSPYEYPFGISSSKILLKVILINNQTHLKTERIAVFYPSMGC